MAHALALRSITKRFGGFAALEDVTFRARPGEVHALLGENGAGKSTLMNVACGLYSPDEGTLELDGHPVALSGTGDAVARGIGMVHQHFKLVPAFTVLENLQLFTPGKTAAEVSEQATALAARMGFELDLSARVATLPVAEMQRLEILKVLVTGARTIILDEPTAVLAPSEGLALMGLIRGLANDGAAVVLVTHKLHEALEHSDRITVLRQGRVIAETTPDGMSPASLTSLIVGEEIVEQPQPAKNPGERRLWLNGIKMPGASGRKGLTGLDFEVRAGEIYGIAGVAGNGQSELADLLSGLAIPTEGSLWMDGRNITDTDARQRRRAGLAVIPVDRYRYGLAGRIGVSDNFSISGILAGRYGSWFKVDRARARADAKAAIAEFDVQGVRNLNQRAGLLSGGNARSWLSRASFRATRALFWPIRLPAGWMSAPARRCMTACARRATPARR